MITCGPTGSTGQQVADAINANADAIVTLSSLPIVRVYCTSALASMALSTTPAKVTVGNATQSVNSGITVTTFSDFTVTVAGFYEVYFNLSCTFDNNEVIAFKGAINGVVNTAESVYTTGTGRPIGVSWSSILQLAIGDVLSIHANTVTLTANMVIESSSVIVKKV